MKVYLTKLIIFLFPVTCLLLFPIVIFFRTGEFISYESSIYHLAKDKPTILGKKYITQDISNQYKIDLLKIKKPEIAAFGSSRVLQMREYMFATSTTFFNVGGVGATIFDLEKAVDQIPINTEPKIILIGLDQHNFAPTWVASQTNRQKEILSKKELILIGIRQFYIDLFNKKFTIKELLHTKDNQSTRIGIRAHTADNGHRNDGSYNYGNKHLLLTDPAHEDYQFKNTLSRIQKGTNLFYRDTHVSPDAIQALEKTLEKAHARNIHIIGFLPPLPDTAHQKLQQDPGYAYLYQLPQQLDALFTKYNFTFFDASHPHNFGSTDDEMLDGLHGSEETMSKILNALSKFDTPITLHLPRFTKTN